ncbi:MAG TPA: hypothetical protein VNB94_00165 [Mycobacteriales bacterium]|nr:hypothetical protein [Mycobacteriales bacterium]
MRVHLAVAIVLSGLLAAPSAAAPQCPFLTDPAGDSDEFGVLEDDALDLRSVDIASNGVILAMRARVTSLTLPPPSSPTGALYDFQFQVGEVYFRAQATYSPLEGESYQLRRSSGHVGGNGAYTSTKLDSSITGRFDTAEGTVVVHVPVADLNKVVRVSRGDFVYEIGAITWRTGGLRDVDSFVASADFADSGRSYRIGARACIVAGR